MSLKSRLQENTKEININDIKKHILKIIDVYDKSSIDSFVTEQLISHFGITLNKFEKDKLIEDIYRDVNGYGAIEALLEDVSVTTIFVNSGDNVFVEKGGKVYKTKIVISNLDKIIERMAVDCGGIIDSENPIMETILPSGARVNAIVPPCSDTPVLTIKKYRAETADKKTLIDNGFMNEEMAKYLVSCVKAKKNIVVCGLANSGRTTVINVLASELPNEERIAVIEDFPELNLSQDNVVKCRNFKHSVPNVMRMLPTRLVVDQCHNIDEIKTIISSGYNGVIMSVSSAEPQNLGIENAVFVLVKQVFDGTRKIISIIDNKELFKFRQCFIEGEKVIGEFEVLTKIPNYSTDTIPRIKQTDIITSRMLKKKEVE